MQTDKYGLFSSTFPLVLQLVRALGPPGWQLLEVSASGHLGDPLGVAGGGPRATLALSCRLWLVEPPSLAFSFQALLRSAAWLSGDHFYLDLLGGMCVCVWGFLSPSHPNTAVCSQRLSLSSRCVSGLVQRSCKNSVKVKT